MPRPGPISATSVPEQAVRRALDRRLLESLPAVLFALGVLYALFAVSHALLLEPPVRAVMVLAAGVTAAGFLILRAVWPRIEIPARRAHLLGAAVASAVLINCQLHLALTGEPRQTTNLFVLILGAGFLLLDSRWFVAVTAAAIVSWGAIAWTAPPSPDWAHFAFAIVSVTALAAIVHLVTLRRLRRLETLRLQDRSRRAELERALAAAEAGSRAKSDFLTHMSHELRTPLNAIIGFTNLLLKNPGDRLDARQLKFLDRTLSNGKSLLALIDGVLDLSRIEAGRLDLEPSPVALDALVEETVAELQALAEARQLELSVELPRRAAPVTADRGRLKQVLVNLVGNALKFTEEGGVTVRLLADATGRPLRLDVADTGIGIAPERLEAIFEAFEQAEGGTARKYSGTGLGLAISRHLCERMGFELRVESARGAGSTFSVRFSDPRSDEASSRPRPSAGLPPDAASEETRHS